MLTPTVSRFASVCDGFRRNIFFCIGRGFLPLLAVILLATPQLAFSQNSLAVTVAPKLVNITEGDEVSAVGTYRVVLDADPGKGKTVEITVVGATTDTNDEIYVSGPGMPRTTEVEGPLVLNFTGGPVDTATWDDEIVVTVTVVDDADAVDETVTLTHTATIIEEDGDKDEVVLRNVSVTVKVTDSDEKGVTISDFELVIDETASGTYSVALDTEPAGVVTVKIGIAGVTGELSVSPSRLFFTPGNPANYGPQTVAVYAGEDFDGDDDSATLTHTVRGGDYTGELVDRVKVTVTDNDTRGVTVTPTTLSVISGSRDYRIATYTIVLDTQPMGTVDITVTKPNESAVPGIGHVTVSPMSRTFSRTDWNSPKTVTVSVPFTVPRQIPGDSASDSLLPPSVNLTHTVNTEGNGRDEGYIEASTDNNIRFSDPDVVAVTIGDNPPAGMSVPSTLDVTEGGMNTYTVTVSNPPIAGLVVTVEGSTGTDVTVDTDPEMDLAQNTMTFDKENTTRKVTVVAGEDSDGEPDTVRLTHSVTANGFSVSRVLTVTVKDNDRQGVTVTPTTLDIPEGEHRTYDVSLDTVSTGNVTITISGDSGDVTVDKSQLTFTRENSRLTQQVTVTAPRGRRRGTGCFRDAQAQGAWGRL